METLARRIAATQVPEAAVCLWWLGQAGFAFKTPAGRIVYADPYLSDAVQRLHGFKRLSLAPIAAEEVEADLVVLTHEHTDHLDPDAVPVIARNNPVPLRRAGRLHGGPGAVGRAATAESCWSPAGFTTWGALSSTPSGRSRRLSPRPCRCCWTSPACG